MSVLSLVAYSVVAGCSRDEQDLRRVRALDARLQLRQRHKHRIRRDLTGGEGEAPEVFVAHDAPDPRLHCDERRFLARERRVFGKRARLFDVEREFVAGFYGELGGEALVVAARLGAGGERPLALGVGHDGDGGAGERAGEGQEHEGGAWIVSDSITPSAINSWVGEELRTGGMEAKATAAVGGQEFDLWRWQAERWTKQNKKPVPGETAACPGS